ncbi:Probable low-affinity inorganic phosphate transporter [hydrothermal vent metagenome]|uniref:Probable low-affinity inorganic phosphate transporter n=1 Tax=hydrothermal vent metagenome TaxID=652676 RepID=A0A1W1DI09_9ZZZZ
MEIIANYGDVLLILAVVFGLFMAWGVGANDVANAMGTSVGSGAVTIKQAIIIAVIFEFAGAILAGGEVTATIRKGILDATTHSIVGAIVGFGSVGVGVDAVAWDKVGTIVMSWVVSPFLAGTIAFILFRSLQNLIIDTRHPFDNAKKYVPYYMFLVGFVISLVTIFKGLKHIGLSYSVGDSYLLAIGFGILVALIGTIIIRRIWRECLVY